MANKITKKEYFGIVIAIVKASQVENKADLLAFLNHEVELLDKKSGKSKETKAKKAHGAILDAIKEVLAGQTKPVTITEMLTYERLASYEEESKDGVKTVAMTNQKLSSMVKKLVDVGEVIRTEEKKKAYFSLPKEEGEELSEDENGTESE